MDSRICSEGIRFLAAPRESRATCMEAITALPLRASSSSVYNDRERER
jgi:hypothetical protein